MSKKTAIALLLVVVSFRGARSQNNRVSWWVLNSGFGASTSAGVMAKSAIGQQFIGASQQGNTRVTSGFLADTLLLGPMVPVLESPFTPLAFAIRQNYPNPFNPSTTFSFDIPYSSFVILKVHNILGQEVATLVNENKPAGTHILRWNAGGLSSGVYFYTLRAATFVQTRKLVLVR